MGKGSSTFAGKTLGEEGVVLTPFALPPFGSTGRIYSSSSFCTEHVVRSRDSFFNKTVFLGVGVGRGVRPSKARSELAS
jgi:hypothetical protein